MAYLLKGAILSQESQETEAVSFVRNGTNEDLRQTDASKVEYFISGIQTGEVLVIQRWTDYIQEWKNISSPTEDADLEITSDVVGRVLEGYARNGKMRFKIKSGATESTEIKIDLMS
jgi:hypothetical protein